MIQRYSVWHEDISTYENNDGDWVKWEDLGRFLDRFEDTLDELCDHAEKTKDLAWTLQVQVSREDNS